MCCAVFLVCLSIATYHTCQLWMHSEHIYMSKTIESPAKCDMGAVIKFLYSEQATRNVVIRHCPSWQCLVTHTVAATKRLLQCFWWEEFDLTTIQPGCGSLWFSSLSSYETMSRRTTFWHRQWDATQHREMAESTEDWLLWRGYC